MITPINILLELQSFVRIDKGIIESARNSKISTQNNKEFQQLVDMWIEGKYDEDPNTLVNEIIYLL